MEKIIQALKTKEGTEKLFVGFGLDREELGESIWSFFLESLEDIKREQGLNEDSATNMLMIIYSFAYQKELEAKYTLKSRDELKELVVEVIGGEVVSDTVERVTDGLWDSIKVIPLEIREKIGAKQKVINALIKSTIETEMQLDFLMNEYTERVEKALVKANEILSDYVAIEDTNDGTILDILLTTKEGIQTIADAFGVTDLEEEEKEYLFTDMMKSKDIEAILMAFDSIVKHREYQNKYTLKSVADLDFMLEDSGHGFLIGTEGYQMIVDGVKDAKTDEEFEYNKEKAIFSLIGASIMTRKGKAQKEYIKELRAKVEDYVTTNN